MSAIDVIVQSDSVSIISDGACVNGTGEIHFVSSKIVQMAHLNAVVAVRGPSMAGMLIAPVLGSSGTTYDEMKASAADTIRAAASEAGPLLASAPLAGSMDFVVAGWSESAGPDAFLLTSDGKFGEEPWTLIQLTGLCSIPGDTAIVAALDLPAGSTADDLDPERDGLRMLEAKRAQPDKYFVGCFGQLTSVYEDCISTKIICRWPDDVMGTKLGAIPVPTT